MVDTPKKPWFGLITNNVLARVGGIPRTIDPNAADELRGDSRHRLNPLNPPAGFNGTRTQDIYAEAEAQIKGR